MNILIDIGHPAHVHLFKNLIKSLQNKNRIYITVKNIASAIRLLEKYNINYIDIGRKSDSIISKAINQFYYNWRIFKIVHKYKIELGISSSISIAQVSKLTKMKSIMFDDDDDEVQPLMTKFGHPFADSVLSPDVLKGKRRKKQTLYYSGFHELAYLHSNRFTPDINVLKELGIKPNETFFIMRFNVFKAHHDVGIYGLNIEQKLRLIELLKPYGKIFITTEREIEPELKKYKLSVSPEKIHSLLYYATMLIGDSQTMTSEAAILGTPAIRSNSFVGKISYLEEEEHKYGLTYGFKPEDFEKMLAKIDDLLKMSDLNEEWQKRRERMLSDKIDVTAFMVWFVENYPESVKIMKKNPEYQLRFK